jgi:hypothetical protein
MTPDRRCPNCQGTGLVEVHWHDAIRNEDHIDFLRCECTYHPAWKAEEDWTTDRPRSRSTYELGSPQGCVGRRDQNGKL